jgi:preprotein translocase subunit SecG
MGVIDMSPLYIILGIVFILGCAALVAAILLQKKRTAGLGSVAGMGNAGATYWDKNKSRSMEGSLERWTKIGAGVLMVLSVIISLL